MRKKNPTNSVFTDNPQTGIAWENWFIEKYGAKRPSLSLNTPFDFWYNGERVDLKVCNLYRTWWTFNSGKRREVDSYVCIGLVDNKPIKMFKIPERDFPKIGMTAAIKASKWDKYLVDF